MNKILKHIILENVNKFPTNGLSSNEIAKLCVQSNKASRSSILSNLTRLKTEKLLDIKIIKKDNTHNHILNQDGLMVLDAFNNLYSDDICDCIQKHEPYSIGEEVYKLQMIKNHLHKINKWVSLSEIIKALNISNRSGSGLPHALNKLKDMGFVIKTKHGGKMMYKIEKKDEVAIGGFTPSKSLSEFGLADFGLAELIDNYLYQKNRWMGGDEILDFTSIPRDKIITALHLLYEKDRVFHSTRTGSDFYIYKSVRTYIPNDNNKSFLELYIKYLAGIGINEDAINDICYKVLSQLTETYFKERKVSETNYLKENNFLVLEDFENMKIENEILRNKLNSKR